MKTRTSTLTFKRRKVDGGGEREERGREIRREAQVLESGLPKERRRTCSRSPFKPGLFLGDFPLLRDTGADVDIARMHYVRP